MLDVTARVGVGADEAVRTLLIARVDDAHRLATWLLHDPAAAEDAVQEAALLAWDRRRSLRRTDDAGPWFNRILVNVCRQELRRRKRRSPVVEAEPSADGAHERLAARDELSRAIVTLAPDEQIVLGLRFGRDLSLAQIAAETGVPEGTVKSRLHYALDHLRAALEAERRAEETLR